MWMTEDNIVEVAFDKEHLFELILSPSNLNKAYKAVSGNKGCGGIDKMSWEELFPWLLANKDEFIISLQNGTYRPNPVRRLKSLRLMARHAFWYSYRGRPPGATSHPPSSDTNLRASVLHDKLWLPSKKGLP